MPDSDLKSKRTAVGFSQLKLSIRAGVSRWRIRLAEEGVLKLRVAELERVAKAFEQGRLDARNRAAEQRAAQRAAEKLCGSK